MSPLGNYAIPSKLFGPTVLISAQCDLPNFNKLLWIYSIHLPDCQ